MTTFGSRPGTGFVKSLGSDVLNPRGLIKILNTFQLKLYSNIYAIGDVIEWSEQKQAAKAPKHAQITTANILAQINGGVPKKTYSGQPELIIITNGKVRCSSEFSPSHTFLQCATLAEIWHLVYGHALGYHTRQLVLQLDEGQGADGRYDAEVFRACEVKCRLSHKALLKFFGYLDIYIVHNNVYHTPLIPRLLMLATGPGI